MADKTPLAAVKHRPWNVASCEMDDGNAIPINTPIMLDSADIKRSPASPNESRQHPDEAEGNMDELWETAGSVTANPRSPVCAAMATARTTADEMDSSATT